MSGVFLVGIGIGLIIGAGSATLGFVLWAMFKFPRP